MTRVRKAVIPAAGLGTRFLPATKSSPKEMLAAWRDVAQRLPAALDSAADDTLSAPPPPQIPCYDGKISGVLAFIAFHEGYHAGQASYLRKWLGHGRVAG